MATQTPRNQTSFGASRPEACPESARRHPAGFGMGLKLLAAAAVLMGASACAGRSELGYATLMSEVPATRAIIVPPPGGPSVVAVLQRSYQNGVSQEIALSTASLTTGQNAFYVSLLNNASSPEGATETLTLRSLTPDRIQSEMEERIPGVEMQTSLVYVQNKFGPFGFATGRSSSGDLCLYAWQQIEPNEPAVFVPGGAISVRLRLCDADASVEQLLRVMYGYTIAAYYLSESWNPYGSPPSPPANFGQIDAPMYPLGLGNGAGATVSRERSLSVETRRAAPSAPRPGRFVDKDTVAPAAPEIPAPTETAPPSGYPVVPSPPGQ
jgi:hypothetical protein